MALFSGRNHVMNNMQGQPTAPIAIPYANKSTTSMVYMDNKPSNNKVSNPKRRAKVCDSETDDDDNNYRDIYKQLADLDSSQLFEWFTMKAEQ